MDCSGSSFTSEFVEARQQFHQETYMRLNAKFNPEIFIRFNQLANFAIKQVYEPVIASGERQSVRIPCPDMGGFCMGLGIMMVMFGGNFEEFVKAIATPRGFIHVQQIQKGYMALFFAQTSKINDVNFLNWINSSRCLSKLLNKDFSVRDTKSISLADRIICEDQEFECKENGGCCFHVVLQGENFSHAFIAIWAINGVAVFDPNVGYLAFENASIRVDINSGEYYKIPLLNDLLFEFMKLYKEKYQGGRGQDIFHSTPIYSNNPVLISKPVV
ncbi:hypothetical protein [Pelagibaculum spongiae]|uniref:Peptidase C58 YopT-type domain-containing protein n=1 Tax=Pelagibaculum spongiae TaxID=2080658 RepID=A0A2V1H167_9GAMM|nr:hypothetical protein [Pelagibaculum spongiae]PVZ69772.1 hypothetical protein DC094_10775 [Pelagibaculum spongiae]